MSHYFDSPTGPAQRRAITVELFGHALTLETAPGVFSADGLDHATAILLRTCPPPTAGRVLDLGCGWGPIAIGLTLASPALHVDAVDVNERARALCEANAVRAGVPDRVHVLAPEEVDPQVRYAEIWSNPPIRVGKAALHALLLPWLPRLSPARVARLVVGKNLGADSLQRWLDEQGWPCTREASAKGFRVFSVRRGV